MIERMQPLRVLVSPVFSLSTSVVRARRSSPLNCARRAATGARRGQGPLSLVPVGILSAAGALPKDILELDDAVFIGPVEPLQAIFGGRLPRSSEPGARSVISRGQRCGQAPARAAYRSPLRPRTAIRICCGSPPGTGGLSEHAFAVLALAASRVLAEHVREPICRPGGQSSTDCRFPPISLPNWTRKVHGTRRSVGRELPHHAVVLMLQDVAVIHERCLGSGLCELNQQFDRLLDQDGITDTLIANRRFGSAPT